MSAVDAKLSSVTDFVESSSADLFHKAAQFQGFEVSLRSRGFKQYQIPIVEYRGARAVVADPRGHRTVLVYCLADYLDLARDPRTMEAARRAISTHGVSVSSVPVVAGATDLHKLLEHQLAEFVSAEDSVVFPTGQSANSGCISALCGARDYIVIDKQVHSSVLEGVRLSGAKWKTFRHSNPEHLEAVLRNIRERGHTRGILVITEGVYGLDGDVTPLAEISRAAHKYGARMFLDDAHGSGVLGSSGAGTPEHFGLPCPDILMGSFSKGFGSIGGWIASTREVCDYLRFLCGSLVFSVGASPSAVAAASESLRIIRSEPHLVERARANAAYLKEGMLAIGIRNAALSGSTIVSARVDDEPTLRELMKSLYESGIWAEGLVSPAVMRGQERIRLRARASHERADLNEAILTLEKILGASGLLGSQTKATRTSEAVPQDVGLPGAIVALAIEEASAKQLPLSWISTDFYGKIVSASEPWAGVLGANKWFTWTADGKPSVALRANVLAGSGSSAPTVGTLGHFHYLTGTELHLRQVIDEAIVWLRGQGVEKILGPVQVPMQVLGAGIISGPSDEKPFLEPTVDPALRDVLETVGFKASFRNEYCLRDLEAAPKELCRHLPSGYTARSINRANLEGDIAGLLAAFNDGISSLPYCTAMSESTLVGIARELREFIIPEFWSIIESPNGEVVAFAGGFPDLSSAFLDVGGTGDVSDLDYLRVAVDNAKRGFLAWSSCIASERGRGLAEAACFDVVAAMRRRGFRGIWTSWELTDEHPIALSMLRVIKECHFDVLEFDVAT